MKVLITGGTGLIGKILTERLKPRFDVISLGDELYLEKPGVKDRLRKYLSDYIIHLAAYTDVDGCEDNKDRAFKVNILGTRYVVEWAQEKQIPLLYVSSDYVFNGEKGSPYFEYDRPDPINFYGRTKFIGEEFVKNHLKRFVIVRTSGLYGGSGKNFVNTIIQVAKERKKIQVVNDQVVSPTYNIDLAEGIRKILEGDGMGIYHIAGKGAVSWYKFAVEILKIAGIRAEIIPISTKKSGRKAKRPAYSALETMIFEQEFVPLRNWEKAIREYLEVM